MRAHCIICAELFVANAEISAITCGHTFHATCLRQWQLSGSTCPQCRIPLRSKSIIPKLYFDAGPDLAPEEDPDVLRNAKNQLEVDLMAKTKEMANMQEFYDMQAQVINDYEKTQKEFKDKLRNEKDLNESLKMQLKCLSSANERVKLVEKEKDSLAKKLEDYKNMEGILNGTVEEADEILQSVGSSSSSDQSLKKFCSVLRSELAKENRLKKALQVSKVKLENELKHTRLKVLQLEVTVEEVEQKDRTIASLTERLKYVEKILRSKSGSAELKIKSLQRIVSESPTPNRLKRSVENDDDKDLSYTPEASCVSFTQRQVPLNRKLVLNKENDSPHVSSRSVAASIAHSRSRRHPVDVEVVKTFKIMKSSKGSILSATAPSIAAQGYDGLGGHAKLDVYPTGESKKVKMNPACASRHKMSHSQTIIID